MPEPLVLHFFTAHVASAEERGRKGKVRVHRARVRLLRCPRRSALRQLCYSSAD